MKKEEYYNIQYASEDVYNYLEKIDFIDIKISEEKELDLTIAIMTKNEIQVIGKCLDSIDDRLIKKILIVDTGSTDGTLQYLLGKEKENPKIEILQKNWGNNFSEIRNYLLRHIKTKWVFFIDSDEYLEKNLLPKLNEKLKLVDILSIDYIAICPTLVNTNFQAAQTLRRIFKVDSKMSFFGLVHEELRICENDYVTQPLINFSDLIIYHNGYEKKRMISKNKSSRNLRLLEKMIAAEPHHPRWQYFYARDGVDVLDVRNRKKHLLECLELCEKNKKYNNYQVKVLSDLLEITLLDLNLNEELYNKYISKLKKINPRSSDIFYYENLYKLVLNKKNLFNQLLNVIEFRKNNKFDFSSRHSSLFHIDYIIAMLFFETGDYKKAFSILTKLEKYEYIDVSKIYSELFNSIKKYLGEEG